MVINEQKKIEKHPQKKRRKICKNKQRYWKELTSINEKNIKVCENLENQDSVDQSYLKSNRIDTENESVYKDINKKKARTLPVIQR